MLSQVNTPNLDVLSLTSANTEYSFTIPKGTQSCEAKLRTSVALRFAFVSGKVAGSTDPYESVPAGGKWKLPDEKVLKSDLTVYVACGSAGTTLEIERWM